MSDPRKIFEDVFGAYMKTAKYKDSCMMEIMCRKQEFEETLDEMWKVYTSGNLRQVVEYKKQVKEIKEAGLIVLRSKTTGKHRITYPK